MQVRDRAVAKGFIVNVLPERMVQEAVRHSAGEFVRSVGSATVLLVQVSDMGSEFARELLDASAAPVEPLRAAEGFAFGTTVGAPVAAPLSRRYGAPLDTTRLQTMFVKGPHFVAPLVKRVLAGKTFSERISVGRARNNDIVLRHKSVSKFHAWFELGDDDELRLGDARSTNKTCLNGRELGRDLEPVASGDELRFGSVSATLCLTELLWEALQA